MISYVYYVILLVAATVLAIQTRNIMQEFNESVRLGCVIYALFLFAVLQLLCFIFGPGNWGYIKTRCFGNQQLSTQRKRHYSPRNLLFSEDS